MQIVSNTLFVMYLAFRVNKWKFWVLVPLPIHHVGDLV